MALEPECHSLRSLYGSFSFFDAAASCRQSGNRPMKGDLANNYLVNSKDWILPRYQVFYRLLGLRFCCRIPVMLGCPMRPGAARSPVDGTFRDRNCLIQMNEDFKNAARSPREDAVLISAFQGGDRAAFDELVLKHQHQVFNLCYRFLGDYQEANDSAQEAFIKVYRSLKRFRFESAFSTWLYRITANTAKNKLKSAEYRRKKRMVPLDNPVSPDHSSRAVGIQDEAHSPEMALEKKERMRLIQEAINVLPPEQKEVVALRDIEGFSYEEIVEITGVNAGTVKSRLARARLVLRKRLRSLISHEL